MSSFEERGMEIDEFAMFQARSMGVETEYLEMAKAGRHGSRTPRCHREEEDSSPGGSVRKPRSTDGRNRRAQPTRAGVDEMSPRSLKHGDLDGDADCDDPQGFNRGVEGEDGELDEGLDGDEIEVELGDVSMESQSIQRSHSFRTKPLEISDEDLDVEDSTESHPTRLEVKSDLKRTLTMPAKRNRDRHNERESVRSWNRSTRVPPPLDASQDPPRPGDHPKSNHGSHGSSYNGHGPERDNKTGTWPRKDVGPNGPTVSSPSSSSSHGPTTGMKKACLYRHDSSGSHTVKAHHTADRAPGDGRRSADEGGKGHVMTSRVERPADDVTVYKVLVHGSQGVGKSTVTRQLVSVGNEEDEDDECPDRIVCVQVDEEESYLEFIDSANCQSSIAKQCVDANLVVYSVTDRSSFVFAQSCLQDLRPAKRHNVVILVANKQDLVRNRVISEDDGKSLASKRHCKFIEVSALLSLKMDDLLVGIARQIRLRKGRAASGVPAGDGVPVEAPGPDGGFDTSFGCIQRVALRAIRKVLRRRPVESTSCDNLCTP